MWNTFDTDLAHFFQRNAMINCFKYFPEVYKNAVCYNFGLLVFASICIKSDVAAWVELSFFWRLFDFPKEVEFFQDSSSIFYSLLSQTALAIYSELEVAVCAIFRKFFISPKVTSSVFFPNFLENTVDIYKRVSAFEPSAERLQLLTFRVEWHHLQEGFIFCYHKFVS